MTLFLVQAKGDDTASLEKASFVPDGFSWPAFVFGPFWLLYRRLWFAFGLWLVLELSYVAFVYPHVDGGASFIVDALAHLFLGLEGNRLHQQKLGRSAPLSDVIEARTRDEAEVLFYRRHGAPEARA